MKYIVPKYLDDEPQIFGLELTVALIGIVFLIAGIVVIFKNAILGIFLILLALSTVKVSKQFARKGSLSSFVNNIGGMKQVHVDKTIKELLTKTNTNNGQ